MTRHTTEQMARITIRLPDDLDKRVEDSLGYNGTKSEFYRQAAEEKLARETDDRTETSAEN